MAADTWEARMAQRAATRNAVVEAERMAERTAEWERYRAERDARILAEGLELIRFEGTCDVCGASISMDHCYALDGIIDIGIEEDGRTYTWIRHYATAPPDANPDCALYSSRVWSVGTTA